MPAVPACASDCPVAGRDEKLALLAKAQNCNEAANLFKRCAIEAMFANKVESIFEKPIGKT